MNLPNPWQSVGHVDQLVGTDRYLGELNGQRLVLFLVDGEWIAYDNHCPHRDAPVGAGPREGYTLTCPWHGWNFDVRNGQCTQGRADAQLRPWRCRIFDDQVWVAPPDESIVAPAGQLAKLALVQYGRAGHVAWFRIEPGAGAAGLPRGQAVVVHSPRGIEAGTVLKTATGGGQVVSGVLSERLDAVRRQQLERTQGICEKLMATLQRRVDALGLTVVVADAEVLLDDQSVVVYYLGTPDAALGPLAVAASPLVEGRHVRLESLDPGVPSSPPDDQMDAAPGPADTKGAVTSPRSQPTTQGLDNLPPSESTMKGPYERLKYDLRRVWECPACQHRERVAGHVTTLFCNCQDAVAPQDRRCMRLVEDPA